jgi:DNA-binding GntR family transcriptional regulator
MSSQAQSLHSTSGHTVSIDAVHSTAAWNCMFASQTTSRLRSSWAAVQPVSDRGPRAVENASKTEAGIRPVSTVSAIAAEVRRLVLEQELPGGARLGEVELAGRFGVARNSVREALQQLVLEGLLRHDPQRGVFVPLLGADDFPDIIRMRQALETEAVRRALAEGRSLEPVRLVMDRIARTDVTDRSAAIELDLAFHRALVDVSASPRLRRAYHALESEIRLTFAQFHRGTALAAQSHRELLAEIRRGDIETAAEAVRAHLEEALVWMLDALKEASPADGGKDSSHHR